MTGAVPQLPLHAFMSSSAKIYIYSPLHFISCKWDFLRYIPTKISLSPKCKAHRNLIHYTTLTIAYVPKKFDVFFLNCMFYGIQLFYISFGPSIVLSTFLYLKFMFVS